MVVINPMKHRDRILMALSHEEPDRCPMLFSEFDRPDQLQLKEAFHNPHGGGNTYELERALEDMLLIVDGLIHIIRKLVPISTNGELPGNLKNTPHRSARAGTRKLSAILLPMIRLS
jgi:hypothetical protein